jgi:CubicO group peptidase (beta-lactamase class C family)
MKHILPALFALMVATAPVAAGAAAPDNAVAKADAVFASLKPDGPAVSALFMKDGKVVYQRAFGQADIEHGVPATLDTRFHVASTSKEFTALAILMLAKDGKIDLDGDVRTYLPWVPDFGRKITVAQLMHHTSGLRDQWSLFVLGGTPMEGLLTQDAVVEMVRRQQALNFEPGSQYSYSNTGFTLMAEIVKSVSGQSLRAFLEERLFKPLGMTHTLVYDDPHELITDRAVSYSIGAKGPELSRLNYATWGATSLITTPGDMLLWGRELLHPKLLSPELIQTLTTRAKLNDGTTIDYASGIMHNTVATTAPSATPAPTPGSARRSTSIPTTMRSASSRSAGPSTPRSWGPDWPAPSSASTTR